MSSGASPVINFRIKTNVNGKDEVVNLSTSFVELAQASKKVQAATERIKFTEAINACAPWRFTIANTRRLKICNFSARTTSSR